MKELTQIYTQANGDPPGDCWRTAVACLLDLARPEDAPHFIVQEDWWGATVNYIEERMPGWTLVCLTPEFPVYQDTTRAPHLALATGLSPRGDWLHTVVVDAVSGNCVWDPHPSRSGLSGPPVQLSALYPKESA